MRYLDVAVRAMAWDYLPYLLRTISLAFFVMAVGHCQRLGFLCASAFGPELPKAPQLSPSDACA